MEIIVMNQLGPSGSVGEGCTVDGNCAVYNNGSGCAFNCFGIYSK